jgi:hypothetical protein
MDKSLYDMPMTNLNHYVNGKPIPFHCNGREEWGIDSFDYNDQTFKCDDLVVVDGQIGNIELVNTDAGVCGLGMSLVYADMMARKPWTMSSGHRCQIDGLRHATDEEKRLYGRNAEEVYDIAEASDRAWKERWEKFN